MIPIHQRLYALAATSEPDAARELTECADAAKAMLEAMKPFAEIAPHVEHTPKRDGERVHEQRRSDGTWATLTRNDFRRAAKAIAKAEGR